MSGESLCIDTSVVVRLLIQEPGDLYRRAAAFLEEKLQAGVPVHVPDLVLAEAYFAIQSYYGIPKAAALDLLAGFSRTEGIVFSPAARVLLAMENPAAAKSAIRGSSDPWRKSSRGAYAGDFRKSRAQTPRNHGSESIGPRGRSGVLAGTSLGVFYGGSGGNWVQAPPTMLVIVDTR